MRVKPEQRYAANGWRWCTSCRAYKPLIQANSKPMFYRDMRSYDKLAHRCVLCRARNKARQPNRLPRYNEHGERLCTTCQCYLPVKVKVGRYWYCTFHRNARSADGWSTVCKLCKRQQSRQRQRRKHATRTERARQ